MILLIFFTACSADNDTGNDPPGGDDENTVDNIVATWSVDGNTPDTAQPGDRVLPLLTLEYKDGQRKEVALVDLTLSILKGESFATISEQHVLVDANALSGTWIEIQLTHETFVEKVTFMVKKDPANYIDGNGIITDYLQVDSVVNKVRSLPRDYVPVDLVKLQVPTVLPNPEINQLRKPASDALTALFEEAKSAGHTLRARSGYRSYATQDGLYRSNVAKNGQAYADKYSAKPGHSEHQTGLAMDITASSVNNQLSDSFGDTAEGLWVAENAHRFGFIIRYPKGKESITGYNYEPWHLRFVGVDLATSIFQSTLTMEEYFDGDQLQP